MNEPFKGRPVELSFYLILVNLILVLQRIDSCWWETNLHVTRFLITPAYLYKYLRKILVSNINYKISVFYVFNRIDQLIYLLKRKFCLPNGEGRPAKSCVTRTFLESCLRWTRRWESMLSVGTVAETGAPILNRCWKAHTQQWCDDAWRLVDWDTVLPGRRLRDKQII